MRLALAAALSLTSATALAADITLYGTVNKSLMMYDDGQSTDTAIVDNNNESTRFGLAAETPLDNGLTASALYEAEQRSNPSHQVTQNGTNAPLSTTPALEERMARVGLAGTWGALFLGQQDVASDDTYSHDLAAATSIMNPNVAAFGGGLKFRDSTGAPLSVGGTTLTPDVLAMGMDGNLDAADSIRFNSPTFFGRINGSASVSQGGNLDFALRDNHTYEDLGLTVDGAIGYKHTDGATSSTANDIEGQVFASGSVQHTSGLAGTIAFTQQQLSEKAPGVKNPQGLYLKAGYTTGPWGFAVDTATFTGAVADAQGQRLTSYGIGADYDLGQGVTVGGLYRTFQADVSNVTDEQDLDLFVLNMRVKF